MDTGLGKFTQISPKVAHKVKNAMPVFCVGQVLQIGDTRFEIKSIGRKAVKLKLLPDSGIPVRPDLE